MNNEKSESNKTKLYAIATFIVLAFVGFTIYSISSTEQAGSSSRQVLNANTNRQTKGDFRMAMQLLDRLSELESKQAEEKILFHLRKWVREEKPNVEWFANTLAARLPEKYRNMAVESNLSKNDIEAFDFQVLREASWLRDISQSVITLNTISPDMKVRIDEAKETCDQQFRSDLEKAYLLFDWMVRNVQTDTSGTKQDRYGGDITLHAWEVLLMGHGTVSEKARAFILLTRQLGIETVMLGIDQDGDQPRDWLPAVKLGDELYLFEFRIGDPIRNKHGKGIATLSHLIDNPEILRELDHGEHIYRFAKESLKRIVAMIDATPAYLSQRMANIESAMTGEHKLVLTVRPTLSRDLLKLRGITRAQIWTLPYQAFYQRSKPTPELRDPLIALFRESQYFDFNATIEDNQSLSKATEGARSVENKVSLIQARLLHFKGQYADQDSNRGARTYYFGLRKPQKQIDSITTQMSIQRPGDAENPPSETELQSRKEFLHRIHAMAMLNKQNATFWLGLMAFDRGNYDLAIDYLKNRCLDVFPNERWTPSAKYNLGRTFEAKALLENDPELLSQAIKAYDSDTDSPQAYQSATRAIALQNRTK